jgi:aryl-alcohol dehydrogenase-like predicted oxidoreductase
MTEARDAVTLGRSGLKASRIGLGLAAVGRPGYINLDRGADLGEDRTVGAMRAHSSAVLDAALAAGVRYFDAARSYGLAEEFLGEWLRERAIEPGTVTVGSKWGYRYTAGWHIQAQTHEVKDLGVDTLRRQIAESRDCLREHLALYQIHSATIESGVLDDDAVLGDLAALKREGVAIGLTVTGPRQGETILRAVETGAFDTVQATYNLHERNAGDALAAAHGAGMGVIVKEALGNGRLTDRHAPAALTALSAELGVGADAVAIAAVLAQPWADVVLSGAATPAMVDSNVAAARLRLDETALQRLGDLAEPAEDYWSTRSGLAWN